MDLNFLGSSVDNSLSSFSLSDWVNGFFSGFGYSSTEVALIGVCLVMITTVLRVKTIGQVVLIGSVLVLLGVLFNFINI
jgi:hypothetical protein